MKQLFYFLSLAILFHSCGISKSLKDRPQLDSYNAEIGKRIQLSDSSFQIGVNRLQKNKQGFWELYIKGDALERGLIAGSLTQELFQNQERIFFSKIEEFVPSAFYQKLLRRFLAWYNRKLYLNIPNEFKAEIYGISQFASDDFDDVASKYLRSLYLHGAHDVGHALQDLALVGCSSFAVWDEKSADGSLIIGRNFDFYAGDDFAKEKIVEFVNPYKGHKFMMVTWGGMMGVVSGMNEHGLTVTINAGKSKIPLIAKTPIAILNREILQYATNIEEAIAIAKKRKVFVSESIFIGSAKDHKAITIEMSPKNFGVFKVENSKQLICSNHFQSDEYKNDKRNNKQIANSHSQYRYERMSELLDEAEKVTPQIAVDILRNREGLNDAKIGYGNEKALNQLLAHHAIVFKPEQRLVWVSSNPFQLGEFVAYDLNKIFDTFENQKGQIFLSEEQLNIPEDQFVYSKEYKDYQVYRKLSTSIALKINNKQTIEIKTLEAFIASNPDYWEVYYFVGKYYYQQKQYSLALDAFKLAINKEVTTIPDKENIEKYIKKSKRKAK